MIKIKAPEKLHFIALGILLLNFLSDAIFHISVNNDIKIALKLVVYISGLLLFFKNLRPFKKIVIYYSFYALTPTILILFYFVHGIFFGMLSSMFLAPIMPVKAEYKDHKVKVYAKFHGFLGSCCEYYVRENTFYLFEKCKGSFSSEGPTGFQKRTVTIRNDSTFIYPDKAYKLNHP